MKQNDEAIPIMISDWSEESFIDSSLIVANMLTYNNTSTLVISADSQWNAS